jgi:hypothetical protein
MEPTKEDWTIVSWHLTRAIMATISSTALPSVALRSPARVCPTRIESSSVAKANNLAKGIIDKNEKTKISVSLFCMVSGKAKCSAHDTGMKKSSRFIHELVRIAIRLFQAVGAGPIFLGGWSMRLADLARLKLRIGIRTTALSSAVFERGRDGGTSSIIATVLGWGSVWRLFNVWLSAVRNSESIRRN